MDDSFKSDNYKENLDSLIRAVKLGDVKKVSKQYNKTVRDLSKSFEGPTDKVEGVAKFVIRGDLDDYVKLANRKPSGLGVLRRILDRISGRDVQIKNISDFIKNELSPPTLETVSEFINALEKIPDLERMKESQDEYRSYGANLKNRSQQEESPLYEQDYASPFDARHANYQQKENPLYEQDYANPFDEEHEYEEISNYQQKENPLHWQMKDSGYGSSLDEEHEYEEISNYQQKKSKVLTENSHNSELPKKEPICATIPKEHIDAKRERRQQYKPSIIPEKMFSTDQEIKRKPKKNKPKVPSKPKNLGQKVSTKPKVVVKAENKPQVPPKSENQDYKQKRQEAAGKTILKVETIAMKKSKMGSRVKAMVEKFGQTRENANVKPTKSKTASAAK